MSAPSIIFLAGLNLLNLQYIKKDTGHFTILVDDDQVGEIPGDALRNYPLQGQTSSVVHVGVWNHGGQLITKLHRPLQNNQ